MKGDTFMKTFGQRLRHLRRTNDIYQKELAKKIGVADSTISMYERGEREPSIEIMNQLADLFNVPLDYLMGRMDDETFEREKEKSILDDEDFNAFYQYLKNHPDQEEFLKTYMNAPEEKKKKLQKFWKEFVFDE